MKKFIVSVSLFIILLFSFVAIAEEYPVPRLIRCMPTDKFQETHIKAGQFQMAFISLDDYDEKHVIKIGYANKHRVLLIVHHEVNKKISCIVDILLNTDATFSFELFNEHSKIHYRRK